jgi:hypothetical protein
MVRFAQWDAILNQPLPLSDMPYLTAMFHYARGAAFTATRIPEQAAHERKILADILRSLPADAIPDFNNPAKSVFELALTALDARIAEASGDRTQAITHWQRAVASLDTFAYNEPSKPRLLAKWAMQFEVTTLLSARNKPFTSALHRLAHSPQHTCRCY